MISCPASSHGFKRLHTFQWEVSQTTTERQMQGVDEALDNASACSHSVVDKGSLMKKSTVVITKKSWPHADLAEGPLAIRVGAHLYKAAPAAVPPCLQGPPKNPFQVLEPHVSVRPKVGCGPNPVGSVWRQRSNLAVNLPWQRSTKIELCHTSPIPAWWGMACCLSTLLDSRQYLEKSASTPATKFFIGSCTQHSSALVLIPLTPLTPWETKENTGKGPSLESPSIC